MLIFGGNEEYRCFKVPIWGVHDGAAEDVRRHHHYSER